MHLEPSSRQRELIALARRLARERFARAPTGTTETRPFPSTTLHWNSKVCCAGFAVTDPGDRFRALNAAPSSALMTQGAPLQTFRPLTSPRRIMRKAVIVVTPMIRAAASSVLAALGPFAVTVDFDFVVFPEWANALLGPAIALPGRLVRTIEKPRDLPIGHQAGQLANERHRILGNGSNKGMLLYWPGWTTAP
jgi:hypothetical protein